MGGGLVGPAQFSRMVLRSAPVSPHRERRRFSNHHHRSDRGGACRTEDPKGVARSRRAPVRLSPIWADQIFRKSARPPSP